MTLLVENRELLRRFRLGEPGALKQVFVHYTPWTVALLRRGFSFHAGDKQIRFQGYTQAFDIEDIVQEVFRRAFSEHARNTYDGLRPYRTYLGAIVRNTVINDFISKARVLERYTTQDSSESAINDDWSAADDALGDATEPRGLPEQDAETKEIRELVGVFRGSLAAREQSVFSLRFESGLSHIDIEAQLGLSPSKIKTTEARIRKAFLRFMQQHGYLKGHPSQKSRQTDPVRIAEGEET